MEQVLWVLNHLDDLECDFSAIHRIDDMYAMPAPKFFRFAYRMGCYAGVIQAVMENQRRENKKDSTTIPVNEQTATKSVDLGSNNGFAAVFEKYKE